MGSMDAKAYLPKPWIETPLIESPTLSKAAGCRIFCKLENLQPSGSFKSRGIGNLLLSHLQSRPPGSASPPAHFYSSSGGNAGLACATAARTLSSACTIVVPLTTSARMIAKIRAAGATDVIQVGASWYEADKHLKEEVLSKDPGGVYVPPFDHEQVWAGNSSMVGEMERQMRDLLHVSPSANEKVDAVVCSVGGGGLFTGIMQGLDDVYGNGEVDVVAVETKGADSLNSSLIAGEHVTLDAITSKATSLGARKIAERAWEFGQRKQVKSVVVSDGEAAMACQRFADDQRFLVELACGASIALCYNGGLKKVLPSLTPESKVIIVVCGGVNVDLETLGEWKRVYAQETAPQ